MDQQNIDRLFREKLDLLEETPAKGSWAQVEKQIRPKKTPVLYLVAASVSLLLVSWIVWPTVETNEYTPIAGEVTHPLYEGIPEFTLPVMDQKEAKEAEPIEVKRKSKPLTQFASNDSLEKPIEDLKETPIVEIESKTMIAEVDIEEPIINKEAMEKVIKPDFRMVKITYIASAGSEEQNAGLKQTSDSTSRLKKIIAFAEKIDPGDVLAEIKTAKDNFINGGLKSKKERNSL